MLESNHYSVLFTGGLDSTYRLCQLARDEKAVVQPVYIVFPNRPELKREIEAQNKILEYICNHPNTKAKFLPIRRIQRDEIPKDQRILDLEEGLAKYNFGWQYLYIALLAKWEPGLELCHETLPPKLLNKKIILMEKDGRVYTDVDKTETLFADLFRDLTWPILGVSRQRMVEDINSWGFSDIWKMIWFCYESVNGEPCGFCDNCTKKIEETLTFLFSKQALHRYLVYQFIFSCLPNHVLPLYRQYIMCDKFLLFNKFQLNQKSLNWLIRIDKINSLSDRELKKMILEGSFKFSDSEFQRRFKVLSYKTDTVRHAKLMKIFNEI